jgi:hypothetical protein
MELLVCRPYRSAICSQLSEKRIVFYARRSPLAAQLLGEMKMNVLRGIT